LDAPQERGGPLHRAADRRVGGTRPPCPHCRLRSGGEGRGPHPRGARGPLRGRGLLRGGAPAPQPLARTGRADAPDRPARRGAVARVRLVAAAALRRHRRHQRGALPGPVPGPGPDLDVRTGGDHRHRARGPARGDAPAGPEHHHRLRPRERRADHRPPRAGLPLEPAAARGVPRTVRRRRGLGCRRRLRRDRRRGERRRGGEPAALEHGRHRVLPRRGRGDVVATIVSYTARPRRLTQALLLMFAVIVGVGAYALVDLGRFDELPAGILEYAIGAAVLALVLQIAVMWRAPYADPVILPLVVLLNLLGIAMIESVHSANEVYGIRTSASADRQMLWAVLGVLLCAAVLVALRDHRWLRRYTWISAVVGAVLLLLPLAPVIGSARNGSKIWIDIAGYSFQPAELAKIAFAIFFAGYLVSRRDTLALAGPKVLGIHLPRWSDFGPILVAWGFAMAVLVFQ